MNRAHFHVSLKARTGPFPGAKGIRARPLNRWNCPVARDLEKLPAKPPASREFGFSNALVRPGPGPWEARARFTRVRLSAYDLAV